MKTRSTQTLCARCGCKPRTRPLRSGDLTLGEYVKWVQRGHTMVGRGDSGMTYVVRPKLLRGYFRKGRNLEWILEDNSGRVLTRESSTGYAMEAADKIERAKRRAA